MIGIVLLSRKSNIFLRRNGFKDSNVLKTLQRKRIVFVRNIFFDSGFLVRNFLNTSKDIFTASLKKTHSYSNILLKLCYGAV